MKAPLEPVQWTDHAVRLVDQRLLPGRFEHWDCATVDELCDAIRTLAVRGAPAIGIAAGFGAAMAARQAAQAGRDVMAETRAAADRLAATRPTAVNLFYALDRVRAVLDGGGEGQDLATRVLAEAQAILDEDLETGRRIAEAGQSILPDKESVRVLTHCNAGGLATSGWGTALAPIYLAHSNGRKVAVFADETRPLLQGARLTAWEMAKAGIPVTVLVDGAAASVLRQDRVDVVITGADRIAANGDTANKIGTYPLALAARAAGIPFYVAAPLSTFDLTLASGDEIPIEERSSHEVLGEHAGQGVGAYNPAFDVTPADLIAGWITEQGVLQPPFPQGGTKGD